MSDLSGLGSVSVITERERDGNMQIESRKSSKFGAFDNFGNLWLQAEIEFNRENMESLSPMYKAVGERAVAGVDTRSNLVIVIGQNEELLFKGIEQKQLNPLAFNTFRERSTFDIEL